ncbi:MAG: HAD-IA family hydrolase [Dehalococcoidia bacterium]|nr:HAD-IA family hydrolase [Dehalococcoidia bacterium]
MSELKAVLFDVYGTLAGFDPPREQIQAQALEQFGLEVSASGINAGYHMADEFMTRQNATKPVRTMNGNEQGKFFARFEQLVLQGAGHEVDLALAGEIWFEVRKQEYRIALFPDVIDGLDRIRASGLVVGIVSNMNSTTQRLCDDMGLTGHVDFAVTSGEIGAEKPDRQIFEAALIKADVLAEESIFIGDQLESDIFGAEQAGLRPILIDRYNGHLGYKSHPRVVDMESTIALIAEIRSK